MQKWIDLSAHNVFLTSFKFVDGKHRILLLDSNAQAMSEKNYAARGNALEKAGFSLISDQYPGLYYLNNEKQILSPSALKQALNIDNCPLVEKEIAEIYTSFNDQTIQKFGKGISSIARFSEYMGLNFKGEHVYAGNAPIGRYCVNADKQVIVDNMIEASEKNACLLRVSPDTPEFNADLDRCAMGFLREIATQKNAFTNKEVRRFCSTIFGSESVADNQVFQFQEAFERARGQYIRENSSGLDDATFNLAKNLYYSSPAFKVRTAESISLQQYSTPDPMAIIAQKLLFGHDEIKPGMSVLEPAAGNGSLLGLMPKSVKKCAVELDAKRAAGLSALFSDVQVIVADATEANFKASFDQGEGFDYSLANPPFGTMEEPRRFDKLPKVTKVDHYILLRSLEARKDQGRSVFILGADSNMSDGRIKGSSKFLMNYLADHYELLGETEADGRMYAKQGSAFNVRLLVVGDRRALPLTTGYAAEKFPIRTTYDQLYEWATDAIAHYPVAPEAPLQITEQKEFNLEADSFAPENKQGEGLATSVQPEADTKKEETNEYQAPYLSASKVSEPSTMIPINMAASTYAALNELCQKVGDIDAYVSSKLEYSMEELAQYFSPEQVDALGLAIYNVDNDRGIINADQTGVGKGRYVAGMLRYSKLCGKLPIFLSYKADLFTDIYRDISDIGSDELFKNPFIFNNGVPIMEFGSEDKIKHPATNPKVLNDALKTGVLDQDYDLVLGTYSQFSRSYASCPKAKLLEELAAKGSVLVLDESHIAAGESNTNENISLAVTAADSVLYASATSIKDIQNFALYKRVLPKSVDLQTLPETLKNGGEALSEAISANMARDGVLIRRELDLSKLEFVTRELSSEEIERNREIADKLSQIMYRMATMSGDVGSVTRKMNEQENKRVQGMRDFTGSRMKASSMNFGSRLFMINRQFLLALQTEQSIKQALSDMESGLKPVIAIENTGESLLKSMIMDALHLGTEEDELADLTARVGELTPDEIRRKAEIAESIKNSIAGITFEKLSQFRDYLSLLLNRIGTITIQSGYGSYTYERASSEEYLKAEAEVQELIDEFPDLALSPIDEIREGLSASGYTMSEVSGRQTSLKKIKNPFNGEEAWKVEQNGKPDSVAGVAAFQRGKADAILITRSGSTGISLHATNRFKDSDTRKRNFINLQSPTDIAQFLQLIGRVNRKGQVVTPRITAMTSGLPAELRLTMMHNAKLRKLSANVSSNRDNANLQNMDVDLLNPVGDAVALDYLMENRGTADFMGIEVPKSESDKAEQSKSRFNAENPYINKLMGRLMFFGVSKQEEILNELSLRFKEKLEVLEENGLNPFKIKVYDWNAKVISREGLVTTPQASGSTFDAPVSIVELEYQEAVRPYRSADVFKAITEGLVDYKTDNHVDKDGHNRLVDYLDKNKLAYVANKLSQDAKQQIKAEEITLEAAIRADPTAVVTLAKVNWLIQNLNFIRPGSYVSIKDAQEGMLGERIGGYIIGVKCPKKHLEDGAGFRESSYQLQILFPGKSKPTKLTLSGLRARSSDEELHFAYGSFHISDKERESLTPITYATRKLMEKFDAAPEGILTQRRTVLEGNVFRACELAVTKGLGQPILYTNEAGDRQRAVLMRKGISADFVKTLPIGLEHEDVFKYYQLLQKSSENGEFFVTNVPDVAVKEEYQRGSGISIERTRHGDLSLCTPGTKSKAGNLLQDASIFDIAGSSVKNSLGLELSGSRTVMRASVSNENLGTLLERLQKKGHASKFYIFNPRQDLLVKVLGGGVELSQANTADMSV